MQILVTGGNGQLGREIRKLSETAGDHHFTFIDINDIDLTDTEKADKFFQCNSPDIIINCAAYTAVDKAEQERELALKMNAEVPGYLAKICSRNGASLVHLSTDYVFSGNGCIPYTETDPTDPQGYYASSKLKGEEEILKQNARGMIIRTSWLYSEFGTNFVRTILRKSHEVEELKVVVDQVGSPTYAYDLAAFLVQILPEIRKQQSMEIFHYSNEGVASWYDLARAIIDITSSPCKVVPVMTSEIVQAARRPSFSVLDKQKIRNRFGVEIPYWRHSLGICLERILNMKSTE
jgi:dTDP-4-dehydrorhamnose reductase